MKQDKIIINDHQIYAQANKHLESIYGTGATFREGQYEAIEATILKNRTLVVQKTGWGKSLVYFMATKIIKEENPGVSIVISPLLALMDNQGQAAEKMGLRTAVCNSTVDKKEVLTDVANGQVDVLFITPESLFNDQVQNQLPNITINLMVIDEAHCISDWGHDFRLTYTRIKDVLAMLPSNVPVLATTATANDRVAKDIASQLGKDVHISRGELLRDNLSIQVIPLEKEEEKYAWVLQNLDQLPGVGIIYCLTVRDVENLTRFLQINGKSIMPYYSRDKECEYLNEEAMEQFEKNKIKAIISTVKLGMGYDKEDVGFVLHYQQPSNIIAYYQQIGRAGRGLDNARTFLMTSTQDKIVQDYFIEGAFPSEEECMSVLCAIEASEDGLNINQLCSMINYSKSRINESLRFMVNEKCLKKDGTKYSRTLNSYAYNNEHYAHITDTRKKEQDDMYAYTKIDTCYNQYIVHALDDMTEEVCGVCSNCNGEYDYSLEIPEHMLELADDFLQHRYISIEPRKQGDINDDGKMSKIQDDFRNDVGVSLTKWGHGKVGEMVRRGKYPVDDNEPKFQDELVDRSVILLRERIKDIKDYVIVPIPSTRSDIVTDFAARLAEELGCIYSPIIEKVVETKPQKEMANSHQQCANVKGAFGIKESESVPKRIILVDDMVDSRWTFTMIGYLLKKVGAENVFPYALADTSKGN